MLIARQLLKFSLNGWARMQDYIYIFWRSLQVYSCTLTQAVYISWYHLWAIYYVLYHALSSFGPAINTPPSLPFLFYLFSLPALGSLILYLGSAPHKRYIVFRLHTACTVYCISFWISSSQNHPHYRIPNPISISISAVSTFGFLQRLY